MHDLRVCEPGHGYGSQGLDSAAACRMPPPPGIVLEGRDIYPLASFHSQRAQGRLQGW